MDQDQSNNINLEELLDELEIDLLENASVMSQSAIPGIQDTSITPIIQVVQKLEDWIVALKEGRDHKGDELKTVEVIDTKLKKMIQLKESPLYLATQIERSKRLRECLEREKARNDKRREEIKQKALDRKESNSQNDGTIPTVIAVSVTARKKVGMPKKSRF